MTDRDLIRLALQRVTLASERAADERAWLDDEIRHAHAEGATLRVIAQAAGISHEQVRRILARTTP